MNFQKDAYICIMAGGSGERFWPMSRKKKPKHLITLLSDIPLVAETVKRASKAVPLSNIFILTNKQQLEATCEAVPDLPPENIIGEPAKRDTAPAASLATALVHSRNPNAVMALLPADSMIKDHAAFGKQVQEALSWASSSQSLMTFAIQPTFPSTGFGYMELGEKLTNQNGDSAIHNVVRFVEKPDAPTAQQYIDAGTFGWNAGMFLWKTESFLAEAKRLTPELATFIDNFPSANFLDYLESTFPQLPKISVDYAIMEKAKSIVAVKSQFDWDDVGTWTALPAHLPKDESNNTVKGSVFEIDSRDNIVVSNGRPIALCGVEGLVIVETADSILVCSQDHVQNVKKLIAKLPEEVT